MLIYSVTTIASAHNNCIKISIICDPTSTKPCINVLYKLKLVSSRLTTLIHGFVLIGEMMKLAA